MPNYKEQHYQEFDGYDFCQSLGGGGFEMGVSYRACGCNWELQEVTLDAHEVYKNLKEYFKDTGYA